MPATPVEHIPRYLTEANPRLDSLIQHPHNQYEEPNIALAAMNGAPFLIRRAAQAAELGHSWRGFLVGAAALAWNIELGINGVVTGFNIKPEENSTLNIHAEAMVVAKARARQFDQIFALAVWGVPQPDQQSNRQSPTLHPCGDCRDMLASDDVPEFTDRSLIVSGIGDHQTCEVYNLPQLRTFHEQPEPTTALAQLPMDDASLTDHQTEQLFMLGITRAWAELYADQDDFARHFVEHQPAPDTLA